jgi:cysteine desulfurase
MQIASFICDRPARPEVADEKDAMTTGRPRIYLDHNATAPLRPRALSAMVEALAQTGNPSSVHAEGRVARGLVEHAREAIAGLLGVPPKQVVFTSSGTEAANLALTPHLERNGVRGFERLFVAATEHACVLKGHRFASEQVTVLPVNGDGQLDLAALAAALAGVADQKVLLALQLANNETGVIQPVSEAARLVHAQGGIVVCDAVQALGRLPIDLAGLRADILLFSAHKFGGPKGAGAVAFASPSVHINERLIRGGGQERGLRAGTENVAAIAGFGAACAALGEETGEAARLAELRGELDGHIHAIVPDATIFGLAAPRLTNTTCFAVPGFAAETLLIGLDLEGIAVSTGAACSSGKVVRSHVLDAMGIAPDLATGAIRLSLGWSSTAAEVAGFAAGLAKVIRTREARRRDAA